MAGSQIYSNEKQGVNILIKFLCHCVTSVNSTQQALQTNGKFLFFGISESLLELNTFF